MTKGNLACVCMPEWAQDEAYHPLGWRPMTGMAGSVSAGSSETPGSDRDAGPSQLCPKHDGGPHRHLFR